MKLIAISITLFVTFFSINLYAMPAEIIIIRHAEKASNNGNLSLRGRERAAALVPYFLETTELNSHGTPVAIYASIPPKPESSQRSIDTVKNLSETIKVPIRETYEANDYKKMVDEIKNNPAFTGKLILICWEHHNIPEIARAFGALQSPGFWPASAFDRTWVITFNPAGRPFFKNLPQRLLYGDSST